MEKASVKKNIKINQIPENEMGKNQRGFYGRRYYLFFYR